VPLILSITGLVDRAAAQDPAPAAPALVRLLQLARAARVEPDGRLAALASHYGLHRQRDWPLAPLRLAAIGIDPGERYWLRATPVTLIAGRDDVHVAGSVTDLDPAEAQALLARLNAHFAGDGLAFIAPEPNDWFVGMNHPPALSTRALATVIGQRLRPHLPTGEDAAVWLRWLQEIEMLLHEHPVNIERERAGRSPANSVWFSCGGTLPQPPVAAVATCTFAAAGTMAALAAHAGSPARALPGHLVAAREDAGAAASIVVALEPALDVATLERSWAAPARDGLAGGAFESVTLLADDMGDAVVWHARRPGFWQRFAGRRQRHDLTALLDGASRDD
jgi:hypothetical protein